MILCWIVNTASGLLLLAINKALKMALLLIPPEGSGTHQESKQNHKK